MSIYHTGSSAFSFGNPSLDQEVGDRKKRQESTDFTSASSSSSPMGDFGGDFGTYLKLLESNSALGYNPQSDPIGDNQVSKNFIFLRLCLH